MCWRKAEIKTLALLNKEVLITGGQKRVASGIKAVLLQGVSQVEKKGHQVWEVKLQSRQQVHRCQRLTGASRRRTSVSFKGLLYPLLWDLTVRSLLI